MVLTLDALHTTKATARLITEQLEAHYILILKGNQPLARAAAQALLSGPDAEWSDTTAVERDRGHHRTERRSIRTAEADDTLFPGARKSSGSAATSAIQAARGPARRSCTASPACPPKRPGPPISTITNTRIGEWKIVSTGSAT